MSISDLFTNFAAFVAAFFTGIGEVITGINSSPVLLVFAFLLPLTSIAISYLFRFMGRRSRRRGR